MNETWVTVVGWVGSVNVRSIPDGGTVVTVRVGSTPRRLKDGDWVNAPTAWHTVKAWRHLAANVQASVTTGDPVVIHGRVLAEEWVRSDGTTSVENVIVATVIGHDLSLGRSAFQRSTPGEQSAESAA